MKMPQKLRLLIFRLFLPVFLLLTAIPLYMYFSHDVEKLNHMYPAGDKFQTQKPKYWTDLKDISSYAKWAVVLSEDWSFYEHDGIDVEQLKAALGEVFEEKRVRGASTITQQTIKNIFLSDERSLWRKMHEAILALKIEKQVNKNKILEHYFNVIEYGPGIRGIWKASYHYFKKHPSKLTPKEGAFLAMLLPSPKRYYTSFKMKKLTPFAERQIEKILVKMRMAKIITPQQFEELKDEPMSWER